MCRKIISVTEWGQTERRVQRAVGHGRKAGITARKESKRVEDDRIGVMCFLLACSSHGYLASVVLCEPPTVESRDIQVMSPVARSDNPKRLEM